MENVPVAIIGPVMKALDRITQVSAKLFCIYFATQVLTDCDNAGDFTVGTIRNSNWFLQLFLSKWKRLGSIHCDKYYLVTVW